MWMKPLPTTRKMWRMEDGEADQKRPYSKNPPLGRLTLPNPIKQKEKEMEKEKEIKKEKKREREKIGILTHTHFLLPV